MNNCKLPDTGFIRLHTVLQHIPVGKSSWWAGGASGRFPMSYKIGPRTTAWKVEDIRSFIDSQKQTSSTLDGADYAQS
jgi:prophage regulatory protein